MANRGSFSNRFGAVAAVGGSVIGLGNIWRFPYVAGENGGAAFILIYIAVSLLISIPIMLSEFTLGRTTGRNPKRAFQKLAPGSLWPSVGYMGVICAFVILAFYSVIAGWALNFLKESVLNRFVGRTPDEINGLFTAFVDSGWRPVLWSLLFVAATAIIVLAGIEKGIERYSKIMMPLFLLLLVGLVINSMTLDGFRDGINFLFRPDWSKVTGRTILQALGQSFFSMSLGMGCMITYGSYIKKKENMFKVSGSVALSDLTVAILSGLAIFPAVFSFGISPTSGPELVFLTLPNIFVQMTGGYIIAIVFFVLLFLAAITSSISLFEVCTIYFVEEMRMKRRWAVALVSGMVALLATFCAFSQVEGSVLTIFGYNLFDAFDKLSSNILMPLGGLLIVLFTGWIIAPKRLRDELTNGGKVGLAVYPAFRFLVRFVIPLVIFMLFLSLIGLF